MASYTVREGKAGWYVLNEYGGVVWTASTEEEARDRVERWVAAQQMTDVFSEVGAWGAETFPASTDASKLKHLMKEVAELAANPSSAEEMADVVMLVSHLAYAHGIDLTAAIRYKLEICRQRTWGEPDADGVVEHVR